MVVNTTKFFFRFQYSLILGLDKKWNAWLRQTYGSAAGVRRAWYSDNRIKLDNILKERWKFKTLRQTDAKYFSEGIKHNITVYRKPKELWHVRLIQEGISLDSKTNYVLRFEAETDTDAQIAVLMKKRKDSQKNVFYKKINLVPGIKQYEISIVVSEVLSDLSLIFCIGVKNNWSVSFSNLSFKAKPHKVITGEKSETGFEFSRPLYIEKHLSPKNRLADLVDFYMQLEHDFFQNMLCYIKKELRIRVPVLCSNNFYSLASLRSQAIGDFTDIHIAWDHPTWPNKKWNSQIFSFQNMSCLSDKSKTWINRICSSMVFGKPFTITEWSVINVNKYAYEIPLLTAVYGCFFDIDGLIALNYWNRPWPQENAVVNFFAIAGNPQRLSLMLPCGIIYRSSLIQSKPDIQPQEYNRRQVIEHTLRNKRKGPIHVNENKPLVIRKVLFSDATRSDNLQCVSIFSKGEPIEDKSKNGLPKQSSIFRGALKDEFQWDTDRGLLIVNSKNVQAATGNLSSTKLLDFTDMTIESNSDGSIILVPLDGVAISDSNNIFLTVVGQMKNTGGSWKKRGFRWGQEPSLLKSMDTRIFLKNRDRDVIILFLNSKGKIERSSSYDRQKGIDTSRIKTPWMLLRRQ